MKKEEKEAKPRVGVVNLERRGYPRFAVDLPIEYCRIDSSVSSSGRVIDASEGGLLLYLPERMEIGQQLRLKLFFTSGSDLNAIEMLTEVVWVDIHLGKDWGDYRLGTKFIDVSSADWEKLHHFLKSLSE